FSKLLFAAIDGLDDFELGEAMVISKLPRIHQCGPKLDQAFLETLGLRNSAQGRNFSPFEVFETDAVTRENVFEVKRMMNTFDDARPWIDFRNAPAQLVCFAIAFRNENPLGASEVRRRLAQSTARKQSLISERRLAVHQHHVVAAAFQFPILKAVI